MAVDTKAKRFSMLNFGSVSTDLLPDPDAAMGQGDRQHLLDLYSGVLAGAPVGAQGVHVYDPDADEPLGPRLSRLAVAWRADFNGYADVWFDGREAPRLCGLIDRLVTVPSVANPPTANYDVTLTTPHGTDLLDGDGENRSDTVVEIAWIEEAEGTTGQAETPGNDELHFEVNNAGAGGAGLAVLYVIQP